MVAGLRRLKVIAKRQVFPRLPHFRELLTLVLAALVATVCIYMWPPRRLGEWRRAVTFLTSLEYLGYDGLFSIRGAQPSDIDSRIVVVGFDRNSEMNLAHRWPVPRRYHAQVIRNLLKDGAAVVAYDVLFSDATDKEDDLALDKALKSSDRVVLTCRLENDTALRRVTMESPYYKDELGIDFEARAKTGFAEVPQDDDGVVRAWIPTQNFQDEWLPSFATRVYLRLIGKPDAKVQVTPTSVELPGQSIPRTGATGEELVHHHEIPSVLLDFPAGINAFEHVFSFDQVYSSTFPKGYFKGKIVFVGPTGTELMKETGDQYVTAFTNHDPERLSGLNSVQIPGVFVQAHALNALLMGAYVHELSPPWLWGYIFSFSFFGLAAVRRYTNWRAPVLFIASILIYFGLALFLFIVYRIHVPYVVPLGMMAGTTGLVSWFERGSIRRRWSSYVSPKVLDHILRSESDLSARRMHATVIFTDLRGFTGFSERHSPEVVVSVLNQHFERVTSYIEVEEGTLDKFMGDGIMAVFGAPVRQANQAWHAVRAAWKMWEASQQAVELNDDRYEFKMSVGVSTGPVVAGHVGTKRRHDFTVIGDPVNSASRLQALGRRGGVHIDRATYDEVEEHVIVEPMGFVEIRGKAVPMECFRVTDWSDGPIDPALRVPQDGLVSTGSEEP